MGAAVNSPADVAQAWMNMWMAPLSGAFQPGAKMPLSGNVTQDINPWAQWMKNANFGMFNINVGTGKHAEAERKVEQELGGQFEVLMIVTEALAVLVKDVNVAALPADRDRLAILKLKELVDELDVFPEDYWNWSAPTPAPNHPTVINA